MGVNIFGIYLEDDTKNSTVARKNEVDNDNYSPYDDLAFIMYVDNAIADIIRKLEAKKQSAIIGTYIFVSKFLTSNIILIIMNE